MPSIKAVPENLDPNDRELHNQQNNSHRNRLPTDLGKKVFRNAIKQSRSFIPDS